jgi:hypothetical protein
MDLGLCQPSTAIILISAAGAIYNLLVANLHAVMMWAIIGIVGTGIFQALCFGGLEPLAWVLMMIPVLIVCFFLAVALFASRMRINNFMRLPCDRCGHRRCDGSCDGHGQPARKPRCNKTRCDACGGCGCRHCLLGSAPQNQGLEDSNVAYAE